MDRVEVTAADLARDLAADLRLCAAAWPGPWFWEDRDNGDNRVLARLLAITRVWRDYDDAVILTPILTPAPEGDAIVIGEDGWGKDDCHPTRQLIASAPVGWPAAIRRALAAEARVAELEAEVARLRESLSGLP